MHLKVSSTRMPSLTTTIDVSTISVINRNVNLSSLFDDCHQALTLYRIVLYLINRFQNTMVFPYRKTKKVTKTKENYSSNNRQSPKNLYSSFNITFFHKVKKFLNYKKST